MCLQLNAANSTMNSSNRPPLAAPDDCERLPPPVSSSTPSRWDAVLCSFFAWAFGGQLVCTFIQLCVAGGVTQSTRELAAAFELWCFLIPLLSAFAGVVKAIKAPSPQVCSAGTIAGVVVSCIFLAVFDLFLLAATAMTGYC